MSDYYADSIYYWTFVASNGDAWSGFTVADTGNAHAGQWWYSPYGSDYGYYYISGVADYGYDLSYWHGSAWQEDMTYVYNYYDASTGGYYTPSAYANGYASSAYGPGYEYEYAYLGYSANDWWWQQYGDVKSG